MNNHSFLNIENLEHAMLGAVIPPVLKDKNKKQIKKTTFLSELPYLDYIISTFLYITLSLIFYPHNSKLYYVMVRCF